jgi:hypothetical protein
MKLGWRRRLGMIPARLRLGFWPHEVWSLDQTIARFVLPRLKYLRAVNCGYPGDLTQEQWDKILDKIIWSLEYCSDDGRYYGYNPTTYKADLTRSRKGFALLGRWFDHLWD